jgi:glycosyltransferase involved in cell wall biosynthesis
MSKDNFSQGNLSVSTSKDLVTVVLCTLNEEEGIGKTIDELKREGFNNILVIDGYSKDNTVNIAKKKGVRVIYQHWSGKGGAIKTALDYVDTPYVAFLDADSTYPPSELNKLLPHIAKYVEVIGKRSKNNISKLHRLGNGVINKLFSLVFSIDLGDVLSGMYILHTDKAKTLDLKSKGFEIEVEIASQMLQKGKVTYVPIEYRRREGKGKLSSFRDGFHILFYVLKMAKDYNPVFFYSMLASIFFIPGLIALGYSLLEYVEFGIFHSGYALMGIGLTLVGIQGILTSGISAMLKRIEYSISQNK